MALVDQLISLVITLIAALALLVTHIFPAAQLQTQAPDTAALTQQVPSTPTPFPISPEVPRTPTTTSTTTTPAKTTKTTPATASKPINQPVQTQQPPLKSQEEINVETRASLVNILCTTKSGGYLAPISGSGVIIDTRGVILTNAHVGQFFLLRDYYQKDNVQCVIRTGSPAQPTYYAELLYLPPQWITDNAAQLTSSQATGTGENDYAFLRITGAVGTNKMPESFPALVLASSPPSLGTEMLLAAYPAQYLSSDLIVKSLYQSSAVAYVTQLFNFAKGVNIDLFSIGGTVVSQSGSSGGAVVTLYNGALEGIIAVETMSDSTGTRDLRAITLDHISRSLAAQGKAGLVELLTGDIAAKAADFNKNIAPQETAQLQAALGGN